MGDPNDKLVTDTLSLSDGCEHFFIPEVMSLYVILSVGDLLGLPVLNPPKTDQFSFVDQVQVALNTAVPGLHELSFGEILNLKDSIVELGTYSKAFTDSDTLSDSIENSIGSVESNDDTLSISDAAALLLAVSNALSDALSFTDAATKTVGGTGSLTESDADSVSMFDSIQINLNPVGDHLFGDSLSLLDEIGVLLSSHGTSYLRRYLNDVN